MFVGRDDPDWLLHILGNRVRFTWFPGKFFFDKTPVSVNSVWLN